MAVEFTAKGLCVSRSGLGVAVLESSGFNDLVNQTKLLQFNGVTMSGELDAVMFPCLCCD